MSGELDLEKLREELKAMIPDMDEAVRQVLAGYSAEQLQEVKESLQKDGKKLKYMVDGDTYEFSGGFQGQPFNIAITGKDGSYKQISLGEKRSSLYEQEADGSTMLMQKNSQSNGMLINGQDEDGRMQFISDEKGASVHFDEGEEEDGLAIDMSYDVAQRNMKLKMDIGDSYMESSTKVLRNGKFQVNMRSGDKETGDDFIYSGKIKVDENGDLKGKVVKRGNYFGDKVYAENVEGNVYGTVTETIDIGKTVELSTAARKTEKLAALYQERAELEREQKKLKKSGDKKGLSFNKEDLEDNKEEIKEAKRMDFRTEIRQELEEEMAEEGDAAEGNVSNNNNAPDRLEHQVGAEITTVPSVAVQKKTSEKNEIGSLNPFPKNSGASNGYQEQNQKKTIVLEQCKKVEIVHTQTAEGDALDYTMMDGKKHGVEQITDKDGKIKHCTLYNQGEKVDMQNYVLQNKNEIMSDGGSHKYTLLNGEKFGTEIYTAPDGEQKAGFYDIYGRTIYTTPEAVISQISTTYSEQRVADELATAKKQLLQKNSAMNGNEPSQTVEKAEATAQVNTALLRQNAGNEL